MEPLKTKDLRPCDKCGGSIVPFFYRLKIEMRQLAIDRNAVSQVIGTTAILGGHLPVGEVMSPNRDAPIEMPGYKIGKDIFLCQSCATEFSIGVVDLMIESEGDDG